MPHNLRLDLINDLNLLRNLAVKGLDNFPNEVCLFLTDEINLKSAAIFREKKKNNFILLGKSHLFPQNILSENLSINDYDVMLSESKFETNYSANCQISENSDTNLQSIIFKLSDEKFGVLILQHKVIPSDANQKNIYPLPI